MTAGPENMEEIELNRERKNSKETIHSGHFMVSDFEAEEQDEEGVEIPDPAELEGVVEEIQGIRGINQGGVITYAKPTSDKFDGTTVCIDGSLTKLFQTMSLAYRQNITSPKWNCFKGLRLRWKDKIRLNNVIWRCWHMQYIQKMTSTVCQFALDVDIHNRPEAVVLEGKYWKRRLKAVTAEYKKWRLFYKNRLSWDEPMSDQADMSFLGLEEMDWAGNFFFKQGSSAEGGITEWDFTDMLFSTFNTSPQLFPFPNPREIARGTGNSDLLQPGLIQLQPDLADDDMMDIHEMLTGRPLPTVPEEDFFPDAEEAAGLPPPSSSPPSVSTPTPNSHTRLNTPLNTYSSEPPSPHIFSGHECFISPSQSPPQSAHIPSSSPMPISITPSSPMPSQAHSEPELKFSMGHENPHRPFTRSRSAHELQPHSDPSREPTTQGIDPGFAVPKNLHKKKYFATSPPYGPPTPPGITASGVSMGGASTLAYPASLSGLGLTTMAPNHLPQGTHLPTKPAATQKVSVVELHQGNFTPQTEANLFAHLLTSESYSVANNGPSLPSGTPQSPHHTNKIRVARITPRPYPDVTITSNLGSSNRGSLIINTTSCNSSSSSTSSCSSSCSSTCSSTSSNSGSSFSHHQIQLLPHVTLSAVTPSSIKSIHVTAAQQVTSWPSSGNPGFSVKGSPPHTEPKSPSSSHPPNAPSPLNKPFRPKNDVERVQYKEHRRVCHINAEQKRRCNIKNNFEMLHSLIPAVNQNPNAKVSKATMLHKGAEYIMQMKQERQQLNEQAEQLRNQIEILSNEISLAQSLLPATGAPVSHTRHNKIKEKFDAYVRERTLSNPKYYVLSLVAQPLLDTFNSSVSTASVDDLCRSSVAWLDQHCSLSVLRPVVSNAMRKLSVTTNILTTPETLYEDIFRRVTKQEENKYNSLHFSSPEHTTTTTTTR